MIKDFLSKLGANTKITVGVSFSPGFGLEMIEIDNATKTVSKYGCKPLEYNYSTREILDYNEFQNALEGLFDELHIPKKSNVVLTMPNVHFGTISLPLLLTDDAITNAIISEVEQSYIFKRQDPVVSWVEINSNIDTENKDIAYTAIQQTALDGINAACMEIGCTLVSIETSYSSLLKALYYTEAAKEQMKDNVTWNLMVIGQNSYSLLSMVGKKIVEYYEEPLALKSFIDDEIYNAITSSAQLTLVGLPANYLFIISETDLVSAEVLSMKIPFEGTTTYLECNKYSQTELMTVNLNILPNRALRITPEAIGSAIYPFCDFPLRFNLTGKADSISAGELADDEYPRVNIGNVEVELTQAFIKKVSLIIGAAIIIPAIILFFVLMQIDKQVKAKVTALDSKIELANQEISKYNNANSAGSTFDVNSEIVKISAQNRMKLIYYSALGMSIPNKLWVSYYMTTAENGVDIKGKSSDVQNIYIFYKNLKQSVTNSDIKLYKLEMSSGSIDDIVGSSSGGPKYYDFEITNMTPEQLNPPPPGTAKAGAPGAATAPPTEEKKEGFQFGKPIFGSKTTPTGPQPSAPAGQPAPAPTAPPATPGADNLPKNLEKIEKF